MRCPYCKETSQDKVIDSRLSDGGEVIRRRRHCLSCGKRFTTKERVEAEVKLMVVKRDGGRVPYTRNKVLAGIQSACYKRPIDEETLNQLVNDVEEAVFKNHDREVTSHFIGQQVGRCLREVDQIAYVRFASVYRRFQDLGELIDEAQDVLSQGQSNSPGQQKLFE